MDFIKIKPGTKPRLDLQPVPYSWEHVENDLNCCIKCIFDILVVARARCAAGVTCNEFADSSWHSTTLSVEPGPMAVANPLSSLRTVLQQPSSGGYRSRSRENTEQPAPSHYQHSGPRQWSRCSYSYISVPVKIVKKFVANSKKLSSVQRPLASTQQWPDTRHWALGSENIKYCNKVQSRVLRSSDQVAAHVTNKRVSWRTTEFCQELVTQCQPGWEPEQCSNTLLCWFLQGACST